jgi:4-amino-4-deoxy-L-arabinose transferase-like glycosyltransferase
VGARSVSIQIEGLKSESKGAAHEPYFWIAVVALVLRLILIFFGHTYRFYDHNHNFSFGWEMGSIGRSLAAGDGFSSPFGESTGPTAWEPPLYPYLIAGVFKVFGIYSLTSAVVLLAINSIFSALTCIPMFWIARRCFNEKVAVWTCWLWALLPPVMAWATRWVWETSMAAFLLTLLFWLTLVMEDDEFSFVPLGLAQSQSNSSDKLTLRRKLQPWLWFGLLWGIVALLNTSLLSFLPVSGLWIWQRRWKLGKQSLGGIVLAALIFIGCIAPWTVRNYQTFGKLFFIRSNFGAELRLGNGPGANGTWLQQLHPTQNVHEMSRYRGMGEFAYVAVRKQEAVTYIREDYGRFLLLCGKRFIFYWAGIPRPDETLGRMMLKNSVFCLSSVLAFCGIVVALRKRTPGAWLFFWLLLVYPVVYYVVFPHPRYRHPIEPEMGMLMVYAVTEIRRDGKASRQL